MNALTLIFARRFGWRVGGWMLALAMHGSAAPAGNIQVRFAAQAVPQELDRLEMLAGEKRSEPFTLPVNHLTQPWKAPARAFQLVGEGRKGTLALVRLPEEGSDFVILLVPGVNLPFEAVIIPARDRSFRPGDFYLHNISKKPVLGQVGTTRFVIASREGKVVRPKGAREGRFYDVTLGVRDAPKPRVISSSRWPVNTHMRTYVFFFDNPRRGDVDFRAIDEFVEDGGKVADD